MMKYQHRRGFIAFVIVLLTVLGIGMTWEGYTLYKKHQQQITLGLITVSGEIACLPNLPRTVNGTRVYTLECRIGLKGTNGQYYGLTNLSAFPDPSDPLPFSHAGLSVEVSGTLSAEEIPVPGVVGVINVTSIKKAGQ